MQQVEGHTVDGKKVVEERQVQSPLSREGENPVYFRRVVELVLEDGSSVFGCTECEYTNSSRTGVTTHLGIAHGTGKARRAAAQSDSPIGHWEDVTLGEAVGMARRVDTLSNALDRMTEDRNEWKARARDAERDLGAIRRALAPTSAR